jgi:phytoene dehydrogenase-like protein
VPYRPLPPAREPGWPSYAAARPDAPVRHNGLVDADVVIIGAGALGLSTALHCAMSGRSVAVVERHTAGSQASGRAAGLFKSVQADLGEALATWITGGTPPPGLTALAPGRFGPLPDDALLSRGLWQYAHYYDPVPS